MVFRTIKKKERWLATARQDDKGKFLGYYETYSEAKEAREKWEGNNQFYKKGNDENYSDLVGKTLTRRKRGTGTITQRKETHKWRVVLNRGGKKIIDSQFETFEEAWNYLESYLTNENKK